MGGRSLGLYIVAVPAASCFGVLNVFVCESFDLFFSRLIVCPELYFLEIYD